MNNIEFQIYQLNHKIAGYENWLKNPNPNCMLNGCRRSLEVANIELQKLMQEAQENQLKAYAEVTSKTDESKEVDEETVKPKIIKKIEDINDQTTLDEVNNLLENHYLKVYYELFGTYTLVVPLGDKHKKKIESYQALLPIATKCKNTNLVNDLIKEHGPQLLGLECNLDMIRLITNKIAENSEMPTIVNVFTQVATPMQ